MEGGVSGIVSRAAVLAGCVVVALGLALVASTLGTEHAYGRLSREVVHDGDGVDWDVLGSADEPVVGWVSVENTAIDYPVVQGDDEYYLSHDLWGNQSEAGCPFLAAGASPDVGAQLVFGHHMAYTTAMFSELSGAWGQEAFEGIGDCVWATRRQLVRLEPLCALRVDAADEDVRRVSFSGAAEMRAWLGGLAGRASARVPSWMERASRVTRVVTLVTCSSNVTGQRWRTAVVFAR
ncbi:MAG: class B sortase [Atopobiaceae bacterium]|jgi:sortase B